MGIFFPSPFYLIFLETLYPMQHITTHFPELGFGLGLRIPHYKHIFEHLPAVDWFEIISENFMDTEGRPKNNLARMREHYPIVMHGIALSIGTVDPLNSEYLQKLKKLANWLQPAWISDHLCWTGIAHKNSHDLLPVPYTEEALTHIIGRIKQVQDFLERPLVLENPSTYLEFKTSHIAEADFMRTMVQESGCRLLLDVNNIYVSCYNHRLDPKAYIDALPLDKVVQIHLSGHTNKGTHIIDTHDDHVVEEVWSLYRYVIHQAKRTINTMIEWDDNIPEWDVLYKELDKAKQAAKNAHDYAPLPDLATAQQRYVPNIITPLAEAQTTMQQAILLGAAIDSQPDAWIKAKAEITPHDQLAVYVNAYRYRLYDVTAEEYPVLKYYVGEERFDRLLKDFVNIVHSNHFNVGRYSSLLPEFLAQTAMVDNFALEIAHLENVISQLVDWPETTVLEASDLAHITPEILMETVLYPRQALQLMAFNYPVNSYYRGVMEEKQPAMPQQEKAFLVVFRHEDAVWRMDVEENEYYLLQKLFAGSTIGSALDLLQTELSLPEDELATNLSLWFSRWMRNGLLAKNQPTIINESNAA
ncbi:MAG: DUF692 family multinuclear iron-containing protein [Alphaproteobacteria bacterium]